jgi:hypothetical protein
MGKTMPLVLVGLVSLQAGSHGADGGPNAAAPVAGVKIAPDQQTVKVEILGKLRCVVTEWGTGRVLFVTDTMPPPTRGHVPHFGFAIDGRTYLLDAGGNKALARQLVPTAKLLGQWAEVRGTLAQGDRIIVSQFSPSLEK